MALAPFRGVRRVITSFLVLAAGTGLVVACLGDDPVASGDLCATYCFEVAKSCTGANRQYRNDEECRRTCALLPAGTEADGERNTIGCRVRKARAATNLDSCVVAGPFGGGACGSRCEAFCDVVMGNCTGALAPYGSKSTCLEECQRFAFDPAEGEGPDQVSAGNDTINCRSHHAILALDDKVTHCGHTTAVSPVCFDRASGDAGGSEDGGHHGSDAAPDAN